MTDFIYSADNLNLFGPFLKKKCVCMYSINIDLGKININNCMCLVLIMLFPDMYCRAEHI